MDESRFSRLHVCEDDEVIDQSERDRLSELPDSLILSILSCLSMFDVVRTTILSKRWKDFWTTIPCLNFLFTGDHSTDSLNEYKDFISGALAKWKGAKMLKFSLSFYTYHPVYSDIHSWLLFAIAKQVEEFFIDMDYWHSDLLLPQRFYSCSSITKLYLAIFNLNNIVGKVQWNNLKSLTTSADVCFSEDTMNQVLSGAPHLEELILIFVKMNESLSIRSTSLKTLKIDSHPAWHYDRTAVHRIWAPNLVTLELSGLNYCGCPLVVPSLINAILYLKYRPRDFKPYEKFCQVFQSISHVEKLALSEWCIKFLLDLKNANMDVTLPNANFLKFNICVAHEILDVFVIFPKLMHIIVEYKSAYVTPIDHYSFDSPSLVELKTVEITWPVGNAFILIQVMEYLLRKAHKLEKMVLRLTMGHEDNPETFVFAEEKVRSMPRSSPTAQLIVTKI